MKTDFKPGLNTFFWIKHILLLLLSCLFLLFGIQILIAAYKLDDPFSFIMTFFASNFIILISAAFIFVVIYRVKAFHAGSDSKDPPEKA